MIGYTLDDLYCDKSIVGDMMEENYKSQKPNGLFTFVRALSLAIPRNNKSSSSSDELSSFFRQIETVQKQLDQLGVQ